MKNYLMPLLSATMVVILTIHLNAQWVQVSGSEGGRVNCIGINGTDIYAGTNAGLYRTELGSNWSAVTKSIPFTITAFRAIPNGSGDTAFFIGTSGGGIFKSTDQGVTWDSVNSGISNWNITSFISYPKGSDSVNLFAGTQGGLFLSTDMGLSWSDKSSGLSYNYIAALAVLANSTGGMNLFASTLRGGVFLSSDNGISWSERNNGLPGSRFKWTYALAIDDSLIYVGCMGTGVNIYCSTDTGLTWTATTVFPIRTSQNIISVLPKGENIIASDGVYIWLSTDKGGTWTDISNGLPKDVAHVPLIFSLVSFNSYIISGTYAGAFVSSDNGSTWINISHGLDASPINTFSVSGPRIFAAGGGGFYLFRSTDNGANWISCMPQNNTVHFLYSSIVSNNDWVLMGSSSPDRGTYGGPMMRNSVQWITTEYLGYHYAFCLAVSDYFIYSGGSTGMNAVSRCIIDDTTWITVNNGLPSSTNIATLAANGSNVYAATRDRGVYYSPNNGESWAAINNGLDTTQQISVMAINGSNIFAGSRTIPYNIYTSNGVYRSTNNGDSWEDANTGLTDTNIYALAANDSKVFAGTESKGVFLSADNGATWHSFNEGLPSLNIYSLALNDTYVFAGIMGGIWRRLLSEAVVSVSPVDNGLPAKFNLSQNYPNPFNPTTTISFSLLRQAFISLKVFDLLGREIATIVSEIIPAGTYTKQWNAQNFPSGVYFYRLQAGSFTDTKKLILLK